MKTLNVGIIGIGNMGGTHFRCIAAGEIPGMTVTAVCDVDPKKLQKAQEVLPAVAIFSDFEELLSVPQIDAVIIAVPHPLHAKIAMAAFAHGKHVLLEKPADIRVSAVRELNKAAKQSRKQFGIMFNQRTNGLFQEARRMVQAGELGQLKRSVWVITNWYRTQCYYDSGTWRATWSGEGGGVLLNQAPHNLDLWQWICGMPSAVTAFCTEGKFHQIEVEDEATIYAEYENGATGVFITSTGDCPGTNRLEITGTRGKLVLENGVLKKWLLAEDERVINKTSTEGFATVPTAYSEFTCEKESAHPGILRNFANSVLQGEPLLAPGYDGIFELTISNAAYLSQWQGNRRVTLPLETEEFDRLLAEKAERSVVRAAKQSEHEDKSCRVRWQVNW